jgi:hypothetical protein
MNTIKGVEHTCSYTVLTLSVCCSRTYPLFAACLPGVWKPAGRRGDPGKGAGGGSTKKDKGVQVYWGVLLRGREGVPRLEGKGSSYNGKGSKKVYVLEERSFTRSR